MRNLARGFTDENGKFRPTGGQGTSSREKTIETEGVSMQELGKGTVALNVDDPLAETKTKRRKQAMILKLDDNDAIITKPEIEWMRKWLNNSFGSGIDVTDQEFVDAIKEKIPENPDGFRITPEQTTQGIEFLRKATRRSPNKDRFGDRERDIIENFKEFRLIDWFDANPNTTFFVPLWRVESDDGNTFEYYFAGGEVNITG